MSSISCASALYERAFTEARHLALNSWSNIGSDCTKTTIFIQLLGDSLDNIIPEIGEAYQGSALEEFGNGYINGLVDVLEEIANHCGEECEPLGDAMGQWSAKLFCLAASTNQKIPTFSSQSVNIEGTFCGNAYRMGCESNFIGIVSHRCPQYAALYHPDFQGYYKARDNGCCAYNCMNLARSHASDELVINCFAQAQPKSPLQKCIMLAKSDIPDGKVIKCFKHLE
ncbi:MAG: hypothetical protein KAH77_06935 [Thiomargarita sp.]|nr:hypothetical protein [Thiomargarita sp.]